jgi:two-component system KDP operon response regulator KdpE
VIDARDGESAFDKCEKEKPHLILLDMGLPGMDGIQVCRSLREFCSVPIIMVSVRNNPADKIQALNAGADDYVTKPFDIEELVARIRANLRRSFSHQDRPRLVELKDFKIDFEHRCVVSGDRRVRLTPKELELLQLLLADAGQVVSHRKLLQCIWGPDFGNESGYLRVFVNHLRKKIEPDPARPTYIVTEPWVGYRFVLPAETGAGLEVARTA